MSDDYDRYDADEAMLPSQYCDMLRRASESDPERSLWAAVLEDALRCWLGVIGKQNVRREHSLYRQRLHNKAQRWIFDDYETNVLDFETVCWALNINPDWLRGQLMDRSGEQPFTSRRCRSVATSRQQIRPYISKRERERKKKLSA